MIDHSAPQVITEGTDGIRLVTTASYGWDNGTPELVSGVLGYTAGGIKTGQIVEVAVGTKDGDDRGLFRFSFAFVAAANAAEAGAVVPPTAMC